MAVGAQVVDEVLQQQHPVRVDVVEGDGQVAAAVQTLKEQFQTKRRFLKISQSWRRPLHRSTCEPRHLLLLVLHVAPVPEACAAPPPVRDVDGGGEGEEAEPAEVVAAVPVHHTHRLQTPPHLHVLVAAVRLHLALARVGEALRGQPPQRLWQPRSKLGIKIQ